MSENYDDREKWSDMQLLSQYARGMSTNPKGLFFDSVVASALLRRMSASELLEKKLAIAMKAFDDIETGSYARNIDLKIVKQARSEIAALDTTTAPESSNSYWVELLEKKLAIAKGEFRKIYMTSLDLRDQIIAANALSKIAALDTTTAPNNLQPSVESGQSEHESKANELTAEYSTGKVAELQKAMLDALDIMTGALEIKHHPQDEYDKMDKALKGIANAYALWRNKITYGFGDFLKDVDNILREAGYIE